MIPHCHQTYNKYKQRQRCGKQHLQCHPGANAEHHQTAQTFHLMHITFFFAYCIICRFSNIYIWLFACAASLFAQA